MICFEPKFDKGGRPCRLWTKELMQTNWKWCSGCSKLVERVEFHNNKSARDKLNGYCKSCTTKHFIKRYTKDPQKYISKSTQFSKDNPEKVSVWNKTWRTKNPEKHADNTKNWYRTPKGRAHNRHKEGLRRARKKSNTPELSAQEKARIKSLYIYAQMLSEHSGVQYHVDHIKPISKGGTHEFKNLQVITAKENLTKGAKYNV